MFHWFRGHSRFDSISNHFVCPADSFVCELANITASMLSALCGGVVFYATRAMTSMEVVPCLFKRREEVCWGAFFYKRQRFSKAESFLDQIIHRTCVCYTGHESLVKWAYYPEQGALTFVRSIWSSYCNSREDSFFMSY